MSEGRLATIDIGTNTVLLLISEWKTQGLQVVFDAAGFVRLGEGMDASGSVGDAALERLRGVLSSLMSSIRSHGVRDIIVTGTSASRDAADADRIRSVVHEETSTDLTILSGDEEAQATFDGAVCGMQGFDSNWDAVAGDSMVTVIDIGGGSTEVVQGSPATLEISFKRSVDMGSVRMTERFLGDQPAAVTGLEQAREHFMEMLRSELVGIEPSHRCIGASGTPIMLALLAKGLNSLDEIRGDSHLSVSEIAAWSRKLFTLDRKGVLALDPTNMKGREDVFPAGILMLMMCLQYLEAEQLYVSPFGVRHGVAIRYFKESE
mgnify:CR=1 FL=1